MNAPLPSSTKPAATSPARFVSVTRLRLRKFWLLPLFFFHAIRSSWQAKRAPGNLHAAPERQRGLIFWTITVWESEAAMRAFRGSGAHKKAMPNLSLWCDEATYVSWLQPGDEPPTLAEAFPPLVADGIVSKLKFPSPDHAAKSFPPPPND
jgi:hypothetical protein